MELTMLAVAGGAWLAWCYWKRCLRIRQIERDSAYWAQVRRECPSCGVRKAAAATCNAASESV